MTAPRIGALRQRLTLEQPVTAPDGAGGRTTAWTAAGEVFGEVRPLRRTERVEGGRLAGVVTHRITTRHRADVEGGWRFAAGARRFRILVTEPADPAGRFLACLAEEER